MAGVDDVDPLGLAAVVDREQVAAGEGEEVRDAAGLQRLGDQPAAVDLAAGAGTPAPSARALSSVVAIEVEPIARRAGGATQDRLGQPRRWKGVERCRIGNGTGGAILSRTGLANGGTGSPGAAGASRADERGRHPSCRLYRARGPRS